MGNALIVRKDTSVETVKVIHEKKYNTTNATITIPSNTITATDDGIMILLERFYSDTSAHIDVPTISCSGKKIYSNNDYQCLYGMYIVSKGTTMTIPSHNLYGGHAYITQYVLMLC